MLATFKFALGSKLWGCELNNLDTKPQQLPPSAIAEKFNIRTNHDFMDDLNEIADLNGRTLAAEIRVAVTEFIDGGLKLGLALELYRGHLGPAHSEAALKTIDPAAPSLGNFVACIRLPDGTRAKVAKIVLDSKESEVPYSSMHAWFHAALTWWVNGQRQLNVLSTMSLALSELRKSSTLHSQTGI